jgi:hypothetical protein
MADDRAILGRATGFDGRTIEVRKLAFLSGVSKAAWDGIDNLDQNVFCCHADYDGSCQMVSEFERLKGFPEIHQRD